MLPAQDRKRLVSAPTATAISDPGTDLTGGCRSVEKHFLIDPTYETPWLVDPRTGVHTLAHVGKPDPDWCAALVAHWCVANGQWSVYADGIIVSARTGYPLRYRVNNSGYALVGVWIPRTAKRSVLVHRLVVEHFRGPIPVGLEVDHIDGNRLNNRLDNLQVISHAENCRLAAQRRRARHGATALAPKSLELVR